MESGIEAAGCLPQPKAEFIHRETTLCANKIYILLYCEFQEFQPYAVRINGLFKILKNCGYGIHT